MNVIDIIKTIPLASKIFFILFIVVSIFQIVLCFQEKNFLRKLVKPFCLLFLAISINIALPHHYFLYLAAYLGMVGDIFLIKNRHKLFFPLGTISFLIGHIFFYVETNLLLLRIGSPMPPYFHFIYWGLVILVTLIICRPVSKKANMKFFTGLGGSFYYAILAASLVMYSIATARVFDKGLNNYLWLSIIGIVFFIVSDITLGYTLFIKDIKRRDFYIMLTYLLAECLILTSFALTYFGNPSVFIL